MLKSNVLRAVTLGVVAGSCTFLSPSGFLGEARAQTFSMTQSVGAGHERGVPVTSQHLERYAEVLGLDEGQLGAAEMLLEGLTERYTLAEVEMSEKMMDLRAEASESGDFRMLMKEMGPVQESFAHERESIERAFFDDLQLLLTTEQEARWDDVERTRRRVTTIANGSMAGETVDLVELCGDLDAPADVDAELRPVLSRYEHELDRALEERNTHQAEQQAMLSGAGFGSGEMNLDVEAMMAAAAKIGEASGKVRDVNTSYARQIGGMLSADLAERFDRMWRKWAYPKVYSQTYTSRVLGAAMEFEDLDDEQRERLEMLGERYERELERANEAWAGAIAESDAGGQSAVMIGGGGGGMMMIQEGDDEGSPVDEARTARRELNREYLAQIRGVLNPHQRSRLPEREVRQPVGGGSSGGHQMEFIAIEVDEGGAEGDGGDGH